VLMGYITLHVSSNMDPLQSQESKGTTILIKTVSHVHCAVDDLV
jgi:hypothetical protein